MYTYRYIRGFTKHPKHPKRGPPALNTHSWGDVVNLGPQLERERAASVSPLARANQNQHGLRWSKVATGKLHREGNGLSSTDGHRGSPGNREVTRISASQQDIVGQRLDAGVADLDLKRHNNVMSIYTAHKKIPHSLNILSALGKEKRVCKQNKKTLNKTKTNKNQKIKTWLTHSYCVTGKKKKNASKNANSALHHVLVSLVQNRLSIPINKKMKEMQAPTTQPHKRNDSKDSKCLIPGRAQSTAGEDVLKAASIGCCLKCSLITFLHLMCRSTFLFCYCYAREF